MVITENDRQTESGEGMNSTLMLNGAPAEEIAEDLVGEDEDENENDVEEQDKQSAVLPN